MSWSPTWLAVALAGCAAAPAYPTATEVAVGSPLPALAFDGVDELGAASVHLGDYYEPDAPAPHVLVIRVQGGTWCGTCRWQAAHTGELIAAHASRVRVLDLLLGNRDNAPATASDIGQWRALLDVVDGVATAVDPEYRLRGLAPAQGTVLPLIALVDTRTMRVVRQLGNPDPTALHDAVEAAIAQLDGHPADRGPGEPLIDGFFHRNEWELLHDITAPGAPPPDPTNAVADSPAAVRLGKRLFFDAGLSASGTVSCATCHDPTKQLSDGLVRAHGATEGDRRTPRIALAAHARWQFWDGRADSSWSQALGPLENAAEHASSRLSVAHRIATAHARQYEEAFPTHPLPDLSALPADGKPGDAAYDALPARDRAAATQVFVDVGKAIASYERSFRVTTSALDGYLAGDLRALTPSQKQGLSMFSRVGCLQCHYGPRLTDDAFHATRFPSSRSDGRADLGQCEGVERLAQSEFTSASPWSDVRSPLSARAAAPGSFKTPSLRGVAHGAPFAHGGVASLAEVMAIYGGGGLPADDARAVGTTEPGIVHLDVTAQWSIAMFLAVLDEVPVIP